MSAGVDLKSLQGGLLLVLLNVVGSLWWWVQVVIGCKAAMPHPRSTPYSKAPSVPVISAGVYSSFKTKDQTHFGGCAVSQEA